MFELTHRLVTLSRTLARRDLLLRLVVYFDHLVLRLIFTTAVICLKCNYGTRLLYGMAVVLLFLRRLSLGLVRFLRCRCCRRYCCALLHTELFLLGFLFAPEFLISSSRDRLADTCSDMVIDSLVFSRSCELVIWRILASLKIES